MFLFWQSGWAAVTAAGAQDGQEPEAAEWQLAPLLSPPRRSVQPSRHVWPLGTYNWLVQADNVVSTRSQIVKTSTKNVEACMLMF